MTPYEMEEQLQNLHGRTAAIEQILPTLATKQDLQGLRGDLRLTTEALQHEIQAALIEAKRHAEGLHAATTQRIGELRGEMAEMRWELRREMAAMQGELRREMVTKDDLRDVMAALRDDLKLDFGAVSTQIRGLGRAKPRK